MIGSTSDFHCYCTDNLLRLQRTMQSKETLVGWHVAKLLLCCYVAMLLCCYAATVYHLRWNAMFHATENSNFSVQKQRNS